MYMKLISVKNNQVKKTVVGSQLRVRNRKLRYSRRQRRSTEALGKIMEAEGK